ncbi:hypothetical protein F4776DRAFT_666882 [Hypoxylon sp. NC0597]|nr:hypothetical protein F4776DRAFT_666882 [Hypoxylon sp. NC0597]
MTALAHIVLLSTDGQLWTLRKMLSLLCIVKHTGKETVVIKAITTGEYQVLDTGSGLCNEDQTVIAVAADLIGNVRQPRYTARFTNEEEIELSLPSFIISVPTTGFSDRFHPIAYSTPGQPTMNGYRYLRAPHTYVLDEVLEGFLKSYRAFPELTHSPIYLSDMFDFVVVKRKGGGQSGFEKLLWPNDLEAPEDEYE